MKLITSRNGAPDSPTKMYWKPAREKEALLVTGDKDFGELVFRQGKASPGVILVRLAGLSPGRKAQIVSSALQRHGTALAGAFAVITPTLLRIRAK